MPTSSILGFRSHWLLVLHVSASKHTMKIIGLIFRFVSVTDAFTIRLSAYRPISTIVSLERRFYWNFGKRHFSYGYLSSAKIFFASIADGEAGDTARAFASQAFASLLCFNRKLENPS